MLLSLPIAGILVVLVVVAIKAGVGSLVQWLGPLVVRLLVGLLGLALVGLGSRALFMAFTGRTMVGPAKPGAVVASLFCVLLGLGFFLVAVLASDTTGF